MKILLQEIMAKRRMSMRQVEVMTKVPRSTIEGICNGAMPRMDTMEKLAIGLGMKISDLFESPVK